MATRFYLPDGGTAAYSPSPSSTWDITAGWTAFPTDVTKSNTTITAGAPRQKGSTVSNDDRLDRIFVSTQQLAAQTISAGTFSAVIRAVESNAAADFWLNIIIRCVNSDGTIERGVIYAGTTAVAESATASAENGEYPTTSATRIKSALTTSSVVASAGDRIQIEVGVRGNGTTSTHTFTHRYGDASATGDFALTAALTTDLCPWVELSQTLTWSSVPGAGTGTGTWTFSGAGSGKRTPKGSGTGSWSFTGAGAGTSVTDATLRANALGNDGQAFSSTTTAIVIPSDAAIDGTDYAVAAFSLNAAAQTVSSAPAGWDLLDGPHATSLSNTYLYGKTIEPGEPGTTVTWTWSALTFAPGHMSVYRNVTETGMVVGTANVDNTSGTTVAVPSVSAPAGAVVHVHFALSADSLPSSNVSTPSGYSAGTSPRASGSSRGSVEHAYKVTSSSGTYGGETASVDKSGIGVVYIVALPPSNPPPPGGSGTGAWSFSGAGTGTRTPKASGAGTWTFAGTGTGKRPAGGTGTGAWAFAGAGAGVAPVGGAGTGTWTFTGAGSGEHPRIGTGTGTWTFVGTGEGTQPITPGHVAGTAVLAQTLGIATLAGNGLSTATLTAQTLGTAVITSVAGTATIETT